MVKKSYSNAAPRPLHFAKKERDVDICSPLGHRLVESTLIRVDIFYFAPVPIPAIDVLRFELYGISAWHGCPDAIITSQTLGAIVHCRGSRLVAKIWMLRLAVGVPRPS